MEVLLQHTKFLNNAVYWIYHPQSEINASISRKVICRQWWITREVQTEMGSGWQSWSKVQVTDLTLNMNSEFQAQVASISRHSFVSHSEINRLSKTIQLDFEHYLHLWSVFAYLKYGRVFNFEENNIGVMHSKAENLGMVFKKLVLFRKG